MTSAIRLGILAVSAIAVFALAAPAGAERILECDFEEAPLGAPPGTGGAAAGEPVDLGGVEATVELSPAGSPALRIPDTVDFGALSVRFEFLESTEVLSGTLTLRASLHFAVLEDYVIYVREQGSASEQFCNLRFDDSGLVYYGDKDDVGSSYIGEYAAGENLALEIRINQDQGTCEVLLDSNVLVPAESHGVTGRGVGSILFGFNHDGDLDGVYYLDNLTADLASTAVAEAALSVIRTNWR